MLSRSRSSCGSATDAPQQPADAAAGYSSSNDSSQKSEQQQQLAQAQQSPQQQQSPQTRPPGLPTGFTRGSVESNMRQARSVDQYTNQDGSGNNAAPMAKQKSPWLMDGAAAAAAQAHPGAYASSYAGSKASGGSAFSTDMKQSRASFAIDNIEPEARRSSVRKSSLGSEQAAESNLVSLSSLRLQESASKAGSNRRSSVDSVGSKGSSGKRSSFALEAEDDGNQIEMDKYGRPSFAPFDSSRPARG